MKPTALLCALCAALCCAGCVTETETDDSFVYNRISTTKRVKVKKRKPAKVQESTVETEYLAPSDS